MKGDFTRITFNPEKRYTSVRSQQGRVGLDADWNEQVAIQKHYQQTILRHIIGVSGGPTGVDAGGNELAGFAIRRRGGQLVISPGVYYVEGNYIVNDAETALIEQLYFPLFAEEGIEELLTPAGTELREGLYRVYLEVWERHITALDDPEIREVALGGPDTATRTMNIWNVKLTPLDIPDGQSLDCAIHTDEWEQIVAPKNGLLRARAEPSEDSTASCLIPAGAGYRSDNRLYCVEIHEVVTGDNPEDSDEQITFKYSRDNGSIVYGWVEQDSFDPRILTLDHPGRDDYQQLNAGDWIELTDDSLEFRGKPGIFVQVVSLLDNSKIMIDPGEHDVRFERFMLNPKVRRWDMPDDVGLITVDLSDISDNLSESYIPLENGVEVRFERGSYRIGDCWHIPAREATRDIEWPRDEEGIPAPLPAQGNKRYYAQIGIVRFEDGDWDPVLDCRSFFPPTADLGADQIKYSNDECLDLSNAETVKQALDALCQRPQGDGVFVTVEPEEPEGGATFDRLEDAINVLRESDRMKEMCIHLLPGSHIFDGGLFDFPSDGIERHLTIIGCGKASRILLQSQTRIENLGSLMLKDVAIDMGFVTGGQNQASNRERGALAIKKCEEVRISGCYLSGFTVDGTSNQMRGSICSIAEGTHLLINDCYFEAGIESCFSNVQSFFQRPPIAELLGANELDQLFVVSAGRDTSPTEQFKQQAFQIAENLTGMGSNRREALRTQLLTALGTRTIPLTDAERATIQRFGILIFNSTTEPPEAIELVNSFLAIREAALKSEPGVALCLGVNHNEDRETLVKVDGQLIDTESRKSTIIQSCIINGIVSLYGLCNTESFFVSGLMDNYAVENDAPLRLLRTRAIATGQDTLRESGGKLGSMKMMGNQIVRISTSREIINKLINDDLTPPFGVYKRIHMSHNHIERGNNLIVANYLSVISTDFYTRYTTPSRNLGVVGVFIGNTTLYTGNHSSENEQVLFDVASVTNIDEQDRRLGSNLGISIILPTPNDIRED